MRRFYCDCCNREILDKEQFFSMEIRKGQDKEVEFEDMCFDCYEDIKRTIVIVQTGTQHL